MGVFKVASRVEGAEISIERPKVLGCHGEVRSHHGSHVGADVSEVQAHQPPAVAPRNMRSKATDPWRTLGTEMLREALDGLSLRDIAAAIDAPHQHVGEMLCGVRPWKVESFVRIAKAYRRVGVRIVRVFTRYIGSVWGVGVVDETIDELVALRRELEVVPC